MMLISTVVTLFIVSVCYDNPPLVMREAQDDPTSPSIEHRVSKTSSQKDQNIVRALDTKVETFARVTEQSLSTKSAKSKTRRVRIVEKGWPSGRLTTAVGRHQYFIDNIQGNGAGTLPKPIVDPTGSYIAYATGIGCGYEEGDGMMAFISDVYGKKRYPILGGAPEKFLEYRGKLYLLLADGNGASNEENALWLYDVAAKQFVVHAKGDLTEIGKGVFSYGYYPAGDEIKPVGTVTMKNLVNRESPLLLLPRSSPALMMHPTYRLTRRKSTTMFLSPGDNECCWCCRTDKHAVISKARTRVMILGTCDDDGYQVYYGRKIGRVRKADLQSTK